MSRSVSPTKTAERDFQARPVVRKSPASQLGGTNHLYGRRSLYSNIQFEGAASIVHPEHTAGKRMDGEIIHGSNESFEEVCELLREPTL